MRPNPLLRRGAFSLIVALVLLASPARSLNVGSRRIRCSTRGPRDADAILDPNYAVPSLVAFVGAQAVLPSFSKCPSDVQFQAPWYQGDGPGFCPPEYWNPGALAPGLVFFAAALAMSSYAKDNRLVIGEKSLGIAKYNGGEIAEEETLCEFGDVEDWSCGGVGLSVKRKSGGSVFVPPFWNAKDAEALLGERIG